MTKSSRVPLIGLVVLGVLVVAATSCSQKRPPVAEQLAKTYGLDSFAQIDAIRYTFNLELPGVNLSRSWVWQPKTGQVSYEGKGKDGQPVKVTYLRSQLDRQPPNVKDDIDPGFVNDQYWLVFPFHVYWDTGADVQDKGMKDLPLGNGSAKLVSVKYPAEGGYTPGDTWDLYVGKDNRVVQLFYHRGGPKKPSAVIVTWEGYKTAGPVLISTDHRGTADGQPVRISFSNVSVQLKGSDTWVDAQ